MAGLIVEKAFFKIDNLLSDYEAFKLSHKDLAFKAPEGLLAFLLSDKGIKSRDRKLDKERMEKVREVCAGMLSREGMTVDAVLDMALKLVSETNAPEKKQEILADTKFLLLQWSKLELSDEAKNSIGITNYKLNQKYYDLTVAVYPPPELRVDPPLSSPPENWVDSLVNERTPIEKPEDLDEMPPPPPEDLDEPLPPPPPSEEIGSNLPARSMAQVFLEIDSAPSDEAILNSPHIKGLSNQLFNDFAEVYIKIKQDEFYREEGGPNLNKFDVFFNQLTDSIEVNILNGENEKAIKNRILFYLKLAEHCFDIGNLQAAQAILAVFDLKNMSSIFLKVLDAYQNKVKINKIQGILNFNETNSEVDDQGLEIGRKYIELRKYLKEKENSPTMPSFSLERTDIGNAVNSDYLQRSLNLGKILRPVSKRVALIAAKEKMASKFLYTDVEAQKEDKSYLTEITLYPEGGVAPTCQSIVKALTIQGMPPFKALLNLYVKSEVDKLKIVKYSFESDERYTLLLSFIEQKIKTKGCFSEEYEAARELLHAIKEHAQKNNKQKVIKQVNAIVNTNLSRLEKAKEKAIDLLESLDESNLVNVVKKISENKNYKELKKLIKKCAPEEQKILMKFIGNQRATKLQLAQHIAIFEALLKKEANMTPASPVILTKAPYISPVVQARSVPLPSVAPPSLAVPETPSGAQSLSVNRPPPLPFFSGGFANIPAKVLLSIQMPSLAYFSSKGFEKVTHGPISFVPEKSAKSFSYSMFPGGSMSQTPTAEHAQAYNALVTSIFNALKEVKPASTEDNPFIIKLAEGLEDNKADELIEAIQVARLNDPNIHIKFSDQKGELVRKPSSGPDMHAP